MVSRDERCWKAAKLYGSQMSAPLHSRCATQSESVRERERENAERHESGEKDRVEWNGVRPEKAQAATVDRRDH